MVNIAKFIFMIMRKRFNKGKKYLVFELKFEEFKVKVGLGICYV
nr:hypothetical protein [Campylobacter upsaliensis]